MGTTNGFLTPTPTNNPHHGSPIPVQVALGVLEAVDELEALSRFDLQAHLDAPSAEAALSTFTRDYI